MSEEKPESLSRVFWDAYRSDHPYASVVPFDELPEHDRSGLEAGAQAVAAHVANPDAADYDSAAEIMRLRAALSRYERITTAWTRGMYSARIDCTRGDAKAAIECLSEGLDGYDGTEWNGTETGAEWWERTKAEEGL